MKLLYKLRKLYKDFVFYNIPISCDKYVASLALTNSYRDTRVKKLFHAYATGYGGPLPASEWSIKAVEFYALVDRYEN